jgi:4-amino-4-deoxy-L-arabinose transferase-like glycosyltransferase
VVNRENEEPQHRTFHTLLLAALIILAAALRFWRLGDWSFDSDEVWMLRDSLHPSITNPRPLLYFLNYYLVRPFVPLDELGLRLLPAIFGVLAIPVFYFVARRLVGAGAALWGAVLLATSPLLVYYSQFGRYWSLVFLLSAVYPYAIYLGVHQRNPRLLALGFVTAVMAVLAHPSSALPAVGLVVWLLGSYVKREQMARRWRDRRVRWAAVLALLVAGAATLRLITLLQNWISAHDRKPGDTNFLLHASSEPGVKQLAFLIGFAESLTLPLVLAGILGIYLLWHSRERSLAALMTLMFILPLVVLEVLSFRTPVSTFYWLPTVPILFIGAGVFLDRLAGVDLGLRPRWLVSAVVMAMIIAAGAPTLISQYRDGRRWDFRGVARWLDGRILPDDVVFSDQFQTLGYYLPGRDVQRLRGDPTPLIESERALHQSGRGGSLWIVAPAPSHAFRTNPKLGSLNQWLYDNCQLRNTVGVGRVDFRQQYLQIYRCPPMAPEGGVRPM